MEWTDGRLDDADGRTDKLDEKIDKLVAMVDAKFRGLHKAVIGGSFAVFLAVVGPAIVRHLGL